MDSTFHDARHAWRRLRRRPAFAAAAVLSLALGIGGASLVFSLVDGLVLRPFAYPDADRLVGVGAAFPRLNAPLGFIETLSPAEATDILEAPSLGKAVVFDLGNRNLSGGDRAERVFTGLLWGDPFDVIGVPPLHGRGFTRDDWRPGSAPVAIISHRVWRDRFGGDPDLVGKAIRVNGEAVTLVGVMQPALLLIGTDLWTPLAADPTEWPRNRRQFNVLGRLKAGATLDQLNGELATVAALTAAAYAGEFPEYENWRLEAWTWAEALTGEIRPFGFLLLGAVGFVLPLMCVNLAGLQLAQATSRRREVCLWLALGSGRWRLAIRCGSSRTCAGPWPPSTTISPST
jgi:hypothetical protein